MRHKEDGWRGKRRESGRKGVEQESEWKNGGKVLVIDRLELLLEIFPQQ